MPKVTHKMLTSSLREPEEEDFIHREVYPVVPPKIEYSLTERGKQAIPIVSRIREYGVELMKDFGLDISREEIKI